MSKPEERDSPAAVAFIVLTVVVFTFGTYIAGTIKGHKDATERMEKEAVSRGFGNWYDGVFTWEGDDDTTGRDEVSDMSVL